MVGHLRAVLGVVLVVKVPAVTIRLPLWASLGVVLVPAREVPLLDLWVLFGTCFGLKNSDNVLSCSLKSNMHKHAIFL